MNPIRRSISEPDAEITSLGVLDKKLPLVWRGEDGQEILVVKDFYLSLRRTAPVLYVRIQFVWKARSLILHRMTHSWTLNGSLRVQCQGSDIWDVEHMQRFLDEMVRLVRVLTSPSVS